MKKLLLTLGLICGLQGSMLALPGSMFNPSIENRTAEFQIFRSATCFISNAALGFLVNFISNDTTNSRVIYNSTGAVLAVCGNHVGKHVSGTLYQDYMKNIFPGRIYKPLSYDPYMHTVLAVSGYVVGGLAGSLSRSAANKVCLGVASLFSKKEQAPDFTK